MNTSTCFSLLASSVMLLGTNCHGSSNLDASTVVAAAATTANQEALDRQLLDACYNNDFDKAKAALEQGANPDAKRKIGWQNTLVYAAGHKDNMILRLLIDAGSKDINYKDMSTHLHWSVMCTALLAENFEGADILRSHGAKTKGLFLLYNMVANGSIPGIQYLLDIGLEINQLESDNIDFNCPPLGGIWQLEEDRGLEVIKFMFERGLDITLPAYTGYNLPLNRAARMNYLKIAKLLLDKGADPTCRDHAGQDAFSRAKTPEMKALLEKYRR